MSEQKITIRVRVENGLLYPSDEEPRLKEGSDFEIQVPSTYVEEKDSSGVLFQKGQTVFLKIPNDHAPEDDRIYANGKLKESRLNPKNNSFYAPIVLLEDLRMLDEGRRTRAIGRCSYRDEEFQSLHNCCSELKRRFGDASPNVNVFDSVYFGHQGGLLDLGRKRSKVRDSQPLPEREDANQGSLFD